MLQGVDAMGIVAGHPFEPLPPEPPVLVVLPPVLPPVPAPVELPPEPPADVVAEVAAPPAPAVPPDEVSSPPQPTAPAQKKVVPTITIEKAVFIDVLPGAIEARGNDKTNGRPRSNLVVAFRCLRGSKSLSS